MEANQIISETSLKLIEELKKSKKSLNSKELRELKLKLLSEEIKSGEYQINEEALSFELAKHFDIDLNS